MLDRDFVELTAVKTFKNTDFDLSEVFEFAALIETAAKNEMYDKIIVAFSDISKEIKDRNTKRFILAIVEEMIKHR